MIVHIIFKLQNDVIWFCANNNDKQIANEIRESTFDFDLHNIHDFRFEISPEIAWLSDYTS